MGTVVATVLRGFWMWRGEDRCRVALNWMELLNGGLVAGAVGSINISNILTGKCLAKIRADDPSLGISPRTRANSSSIRSSVQEALEDVTALFYDEERNEIYTGNRHGLVHVWSN